MKLSKELIVLGFALTKTKKAQLKEFLATRKTTSEAYVEKFFGGWDDKWQDEFNTKIFIQSLSQTFFKTITLKGKIVGFCGYSIFKDNIGCVTMQLVDVENREKFIVCFVEELKALSNKVKLPIFMKLFKGHSDNKLWRSLGFEIMSQNDSHNSIIYKIKKENVMDRKPHEKYAKKLFKGKTRKMVLAQIENFYQLQGKTLVNRKYNIGDDVILDKGILMTGFAYKEDYVQLIASEGKISGDFVGVATRGGVKNAVSTWKFDKKIKLADYVVKYSGMTVAWDKNAVMVPYGKLDAFVEKMRKEDFFCWQAESTREMRFLPNLAKPNNQIALIFNLTHPECQDLLKNDLMLPEMGELYVEAKQQKMRKEEKALQDFFGQRVSYILFGVPRNCIEGLFVNEKIAKSKTQLKKLKKLFPDCYICGIDGKVIA